MKTRLKVIALVGLSSVLAACATANTVLNTSVLGSDPFAQHDETSAYGAFLAARYAAAQRDAEGAAGFYAEALERAPDQSALLDRAFVASMIAGDLEQSLRQARDSVTVGDQSRLAGLYVAADYLQDRRYRRVDSTLAEAPDYGPFNAFLSDVLAQWSRVGQGKADEALVEAQSMQAPGYLSAFAQFQTALIADAAGETELAREQYTAALMVAPYRRMVTIEFGAFLERNDEARQAAALYRAYLEVAPDEPSVMEALARVEAGRRPPARLRPTEGAARASFGPAAALAAQADMDLTLIYLRIVQRLDPDYGPTRTLLAGQLERIGLPDAALAEYDAVPDGPFRMGADIDRIWLMARTSRLEDATVMARQLFGETGDNEARLILADLLRVQGECSEAEGLYADVIEDKRASDEPDDWRYHYFRAACLHDLDRWDEAEPEFEAALALAPHEAQVLNYLGYMWIDRGENLDEAFTMVARAAALEPESGYIIDSLGWAHYRLGDYEAAVRELERAASLEPGNATANYHLGDAYWQVGRLIEARFQWQRAIELDPEPEERTGLEFRLAHGRLPEESELDSFASSPDSLADTPDTAAE